MKLPRSFYARDAVAVARDLIGTQLVVRHGRGTQVGRIVETEAYQGPEDLAAHSAGGRRTARTEVMFGPAGFAYVYLIYGMWNCLNVVVAQRGVPQAVLLRALEPVRDVTQPTWGPGLLCRALGIDRTYNALDLRGAALWIERGIPRHPLRMGQGTRIGVDYAGEWAQRPWRFFDADSPFVSTVTRATRARATRTRRDQIQV